MARITHEEGPAERFFFYTLGGFIALLVGLTTLTTLLLSC